MTLTNPTGSTAHVRFNTSREDRWDTSGPPPKNHVNWVVLDSDWEAEFCGCAGLDPRLRSAVSAGVGDGERGLRRGLRAPGVGVRPKWVLEYSPSNKRIRYFVSITYVRTGLWTAHKFCGGGVLTCHKERYLGLKDTNVIDLEQILRARVAAG